MVLCVCHGHQLFGIGYHFKIFRSQVATGEKKLILRPGGSFTSLTVPQKKVTSKNLYFILTTPAVAMSPTIKNNHYTTFKACLCFAISPFLCAAWYPSTVASTHCRKIQYHRVWLLRQELPRQEQWLYAPSAVHRPNLPNAKEIWMSMVFFICNNKSNFIWEWLFRRQPVVLQSGW